MSDMLRKMSYGTSSATDLSLAELYGTTVDGLLGDEEAPDKVDDTVILQMNNNKILEILGLAVILILSLNIPMGGIITSIFIIIWLKYTKRKYQIIYILCIICLLVSMHEIFIYISQILSVGNSRIIMLE